MHGVRPIWLGSQVGKLLSVSRKTVVAAMIVISLAFLIGGGVAVAVHSARWAIPLLLIGGVELVLLVVWSTNHRSA